MLYQLTENEFAFLRMFCELPGLPGFPDMQEPIPADRSLEAVHSLEEKGYLEKDEEGKYALGEELSFLMICMKNASSAFSVTMKDKAMSSYFLEDVIVLLQKTQDYELLWLPHLPLLIGAIAEFLQPFINRETTGQMTCPADQLASVRERLLAEGCTKLWELSFYEGGDRDSSREMELYGDSRRQVHLRRDGETLYLSEPDKADLVNSITNVIARLHAQSILGGAAT
jgi:hypothetical protein